MQRHHMTMPILLGLCFTTPTFAATAIHKGSITQAASGLNGTPTSPDCVTQKPVAMVIRHGYVDMAYRDSHRHLIHYRGRVNADGVVTAYNRDRSGLESTLTGNISGNQLTAQIQHDHGKCNYTVTMTKMSIEVSLPQN